MRRRGRKPFRSLGRQQPKPRRLSSGLVARSGGNRGRAGRARGIRATRATCCAISSPRSRRTAIGSRTNGWAAPRSGRACNSTRRRFPILLASTLRRTRRAGRHSGQGHDHARGGLHRPRRPRDRTGPLGGRCRRQHLHAGRRDRRAGRSQRVSRRRGHRHSRCDWPTSGTRGWRIGRSSLDTPLARQYRRRRLLYRTVPVDCFDANGGALRDRCRSRISPPIRICRPTRRSPPISCNSCASACAAPTIPHIARHRESGRRAVERRRRRAVRSGIAITTTAMANTTTAAPSTATGRGRGWPLLTGERGHYALVRGRGRHCPISKR